MLRYHLDVDGLQLGTVDFKIEKRGLLAGVPSTEYRSVFRLDALVSAFFAIDGRAATVVPDVSYWPSHAMSRYVMQDDNIEENVAYQAEGTSLSVTHTKNGATKQKAYAFAHPVTDFVTAFYVGRGLPADVDGCVIIYGNDRVFTFWVHGEGQFPITTPAGPRPANRFRIRYGHERSKQPVDALVWVSPEPAHVPYRAEIHGAHKLAVQIHAYELGAER